MGCVLWEAGHRYWVWDVLEALCPCVSVMLCGVIRSGWGCI